MVTRPNHPPEKVRELQRRLYIAAKRKQERRFHALWIWRSDVLLEAWVVRDGLPSNTVSVAVAARAPRLLLITTTGYGAIQNGADNPATFAIPVSYSVPGVATLQAHPAHAGDTIILYGIGLGATSPAVGTGAPAPGTPPFAQLTSQVQVIFGDSFFGAKAAPLFAGLAPGFAGLYQVNVKIPADFAGKGAVLVSLLFGDGTFSNPVNVEIQ